MSMPIRRTTARLAVTGALALGSAGLLAGPALGQANPYPPRDIDITVVTPGAIIEVDGHDWGPGTTVTITRRNPSGSGTERTTATVAEDGSFSAPIEVPEDAGGTEIQYEVSGVDEQGNERQEVKALNVQLTRAQTGADSDASELAAPATPAEDGDWTGLALAAGGAVALAGGAAVARRRVTSDS